MICVCVLYVYMIIWYYAPLLRQPHLSWFQEPLPEDPTEQARKTCHGLSQKWWCFEDVGNKCDMGHISSRPIRPIPGPSLGALAQSWRCDSTTAVFGEVVLIPPDLQDESQLFSLGVSWSSHLAQAPNIGIGCYFSASFWGYFIWFPLSPKHLEHLGT